MNKEWVKALGDLRIAVASLDAKYRTDGSSTLSEEGMRLYHNRFRETLAAFHKADVSAGAAREEGGG